MDKSEDLQTKEVKETCAKSAGHFSIQDTKAMVKTIIVFWIEKILFILTGRCRQVTPPAGTKGSIDTREGSK